VLNPCPELGVSTNEKWKLGRGATAMKIGFHDAIGHLDEVLSLRKSYEEENANKDYKALTWQQEEDLYTAYVHALERCSPSRSFHYRRFRELTTPESLGSFDLQIIIQRLEGILRALRRDWCGMRLDTFMGLVHAEMFSDMLQGAAYLLGEGYYGPAAVMVGAVLEQHIRRLCDKHSIETTFERNGETVPKKLEAMNMELAKHYANDKQDQKEVTTLAGLRNYAAHGEFEKFDKRQVDVMIQSISGFINRNPA
jgi:hypothetical protein